MKNIEKWLKENGIEYRKCKYGNPYYFNDGFQVDGLRISFYFDEVGNTRKQEKKQCNFYPVTLQAWAVQSAAVASRQKPDILENGGYGMDNSEREKSPLGRFEIIAERYIYGTEAERKIILDFFDGSEKETFLNAAGLYHLFTDQYFYNTIRDVIGKKIYEDFNK